MSSLKPLGIKELEGHLQTELNQSGNWAGSEWRDAIRQSLDYFLHRKKGDEIPGRSGIQSGDVADTVDHVHAELQPMYNVETLCEVGEEGPQDENADIETEALNWYWRERLRGAEVLDESIQDGLLSRNGYLKIWFEESYGLPYEQTFEGTYGQVVMALRQLAEDSNKLDFIEGGVVQAAVYAEPNPLVSYIAATDLAPVAIQEEIISVTYKITPLHREVKADSPAPEDMFVSRDAVGSNMQKPRFVAQNRRMTRQDVIGLGIWEKDALRLTEQQGNYNSDVKTARKTDNNEYRQSGADTLGRTVELFEAYFKIDWDRDGVTELLKIFCSRQGDIMHWATEDGEQGEPCIELVRVRPFASGSPMKLSHRHQGRSLHDKEKEVEDTKRAMIRQLIDNLTEANNTTSVYARNIDDEDIEETEVGRSIRADNPTADVVQLPFNRIADESLKGLAYMDKVRRERVGSSIDTSRENVAVQQAAHSTERIMSAMERVVSMYARNFANNLIRDAFVLLHEQLKLMPGKLSFKAGSDWRETEPRYWIQRNRISVNLGKSDGEKARSMGALSQVIAIQREDGPRVLSKGEYEARLDFSRMADLKDPGQYWLDPESPEGQQLAAQQAQQAQQQQQMAMEQQRMLFAAQAGIAQMQEQTKRMQDERKMLEDQRDRLADMVKHAEDLRKEYVEMELKYQVDVPGEGIEGGELAEAGSGYVQ